jgi:hypothetical protein
MIIHDIYHRKIYQDSKYWGLLVIQKTIFTGNNSFTDFREKCGFGRKMIPLPNNTQMVFESSLISNDCL